MKNGFQLDRQVNNLIFFLHTLVDPPIIQTVSNNIAEKHNIKTKIKMAMKNPDLS